MLKILKDTLKLFLYTRYDYSYNWNWQQWFWNFQMLYLINFQEKIVLTNSITCSIWFRSFHVMHLGQTWQRKLQFSNRRLPPNGYSNKNWRLQTDYSISSSHYDWKEKQWHCDKVFIYCYISCRNSKTSLMKKTLFPTQVVPVFEEEISTQTK